MSQETFYVEDDGVDHIRIDIGAKTKLGRYLANTARTPFRHPRFGTFESLEGFWQYLSSGCKHSICKNTHGRAALLLGHSLDKIYQASFHNTIADALRCKIIQSDVLPGLISDNKLPFALYEVDAQGDTIPHNAWFIKELNAIVKERPWLTQVPNKKTAKKQIAMERA